MLLWSNYHARAHEPHKRNDLVSRKAMSVDEICTNQTTCPTKARFTVDCNGLVLNSDRFMGELDKLFDKGKRRAGAIVEDHVQMVDSKSGEVGRRVEFRVKAHDEADVVCGEMREYILKRFW